ncbi:MAG: NAD(P)-dependent oxidoreductase [Gammaproteobacteria bacterium]|nr:NAD(P)-dependent oxidoreductase [Gammaproteobacteria bacterium]NBY23419.1 NAD(P)-dependent oxidoreductase [Gammaproteobacteria bacterium]NDE33810.1 NAD(P)-dependent oxidoreductase [Gammaproteobacteria bacterium]NDE55802.1 NAD(P)-dependent oxidoreductase [Gammaproteobacteria bacterium]
MNQSKDVPCQLGWIGTGRMGLAMADRLLSAGHELKVWNRTASKALPLAEKGAMVAQDLSELGSCDIVFMIVASHHEVDAVLLGERGLLSGKNKPRIIVDCTSIGSEESAFIREKLFEHGIAFIAAPVSGNAKVIHAGKLSIVASGPEDAFKEVKPYLYVIGQSVSYVGTGDLARIAKICHNVMLGVVTQNLSEILVLAEKSGLKRHDFLNFLNSSVMGSLFTRYKSPALTNLDFEVTFTPQLMLKDLDLGLSAARALGVPMPTTSVTRDQVQSLIGQGYEDDFSQLLLLEAAAAGLLLKTEETDVDDGL